MVLTDTGYGWDGDLLDLDAYLARLGYDGDLAPTVPTLRALHHAHVTRIPFENLEVILGRGIPLDVESLQDKMVRRARGGYCFEHVRLFAAALERLEFGVTGLSSRVAMGGGGLHPATHALLRVRTAETADTGREWLCDVGFGQSPLEPIAFADGAEIAPGDWRFRLTRHTAPSQTWGVSSLGPDGWVDMHRFTLNPQYPVDYRVGNHYIATHPRSPFVRGLRVQRTGPRLHHTLNGTELTTTRIDDHQVQPLEPAEVPKVLGDVFGITVDPGDAAELTERLR